MPSNTARGRFPDHTNDRFVVALAVARMREQIETNVRFLEQYVAAGQVEVRRFSSPRIGRIVLTERCAYFTPYRKDRHGRDSVVYKFRRGDMYDSYSRLFEQLWESAGEAETR
jgi:hypothetical protein